MTRGADTADRRGLFLRVFGRVQGVGFRWYVRDAAREAGVSGWARNAADGTVEIEAGGSPAALKRLLEAVRRGPPASRVDRVEEIELRVTPEGDRFEIRH